MEVTKLKFALVSLERLLSKIWALFISRLSLLSRGGFITLYKRGIERL